jgi:nucleotide-binding universal stress UspA family protein
VYERILVGTDGSGTAARAVARALSALIDAVGSGRDDLVVTGNKGMTGVSRFSQIGAVPDKLSHHLPTSMLVVRAT